MHQWDSILDYKASSMQAAASIESTLNNFIQNVAALQRFTSHEEKQVYNADEVTLVKAYADLNNCYFSLT